MSSDPSDTEEAVVMAERHEKAACSRCAHSFGDHVVFGPGGGCTCYIGHGQSCRCMGYRRPQ